MNSKTLNNGASSIGLEKMIIPSILLHLAIIALVITSPVLYINKTSSPRIYMVNLVSAPSEKPLGLGGQQTDKEVEKIEPVKKITPAPISKRAKDVPIAPLKKRVIAESGFAKKISPDEIRDRESSKKIEEAISRIKRETSRQGNQKNSVMDETNAPKGGEGVIASGTTGLRFKIYYTVIWGKIKEGWVLPGGLIKNKEGLEAVVSFKILRDGKIKDVRFEKSSGNSYFDKSVLRAVGKADPLPPLPIEYKEDYLDIGIRFHSSEL